MKRKIKSSVDAKMHADVVGRKYKFCCGLFSLLRPEGMSLSDPLRGFFCPVRQFFRELTDSGNCDSIVLGGERWKYIM